MARHALLSCLAFPYCVIQCNLRKRTFDQFLQALVLGRKENCLFVMLKEGKVVLMQTLARSGNNVSLFP